MTINIDIPDDLYDSGNLGIAGLCFAQNELEHDERQRKTRIISDTGYTAGHLVAHASDFTYGDTIGLHLGQIDQLTFVALPPKLLKALFIDCRAESPSLRQHVVLRFRTSLRRRLVIPAGVAHTFEGIGDVLTRNDLILYSSNERKLWKIEDDLISIPIDTPPEKIDTVTPNSLLIPKQVALLFYRLQSSLMRGGPYNQEATKLIQIPDAPNDTQISWLEIRSNSYFLVAENSWGLLPTTNSCKVDLELLQLSPSNIAWYAHEFFTAIYTFLIIDSAPVTLMLKGSIHHPVNEVTMTLEINLDERSHLCIPAGSVYGFKGDGPILVRLELEDVAQRIAEPHNA